MQDNILNKETEFIKKDLGFMADDIKGKYTSDIVAKYANGNPYIDSAKGSVDAWSSSIDRNLGKQKTSTFSDIKQSDVYADLSSGDRIAKFDVIPGNAKSVQDVEEMYAQDQSTSSKWTNGIQKFLGKTGTAVIGGIVGTVNGVLQFSKDGSFQSTYDNNFNDWLDDLNTKMDYKLPNYYTKQEKDNNFGQSLGSANFWANDVLGGASFTVGTIVSEGLWAWATGGASLGTTAARVGSKAGRLFRAGEETSLALNKINAVTKKPILEAFMTGKISTNTAIKFGQAGELANTARFTYTSAGFESGQEARHYMRDARENFSTSFEEQNGRQPTVDEYRDFESNLTKSANSLFAFNMAIVGSSNLAIFGKTLGVNSPIKFPNKWANETFFGIGSKTAANGTLETIKASRLQNIAAKTFSVLETPIIEGVYEEGLQSAGQNTAKGWIKSTYDPKYMGNSMDLGVAFTEGIAETYGSKEGWKEIGVGMIIGLLSGTGVSVASGKGLFGNLKDARASNEEEVKLRNNYTVEKTLGWIHTANRVAAFTEEGEAAQEKGDITGSELSRASAMIAHITHAHNFDFTDQALEEFKVGVNTMDSETLKKQYGFETEEEVQNFKNTLYTEYSDLTKEYKKQRQYVGYMIGSNATEFGKAANIEDIKEAVAYELTLGSKAYEFSGELLTDLQNSLAKNYNTKGQSIANALQAQDILWSASKDVRKSFLLKQKELKTSRNEKVELEKQRVSLEKSKNSKEDNKADLNRLNSVMVDIETNELKLTQLETELEGVLSAAQLQNPYNKSEQAFIAAKDLENIEQDLGSITKLVKDFKETNPREGYRLEGILKEYQKSKVAFMRYADLARQVSNPELGFRGKRNIISELMSDKTPTAVTLEFMEDMASNMSRIKTEQLEETSQFTPEFLKAKRESMVKPVEDKKVSTIQDIIEENPYLFDYVGKTEDVKKPTDEEIKEYKELLRRVKKTRKIDNEKATRNSPSYYARKGVKTGMSTNEMERFQELNQMMSDWRFYEGAFNSEGISIADLVEQELSRAQEISPNVVQDELTVDDFVLVATPEEFIPNTKNTEFRKSSVIQTYENVKVQVRDGNYQFSHLKINSILEKITGSYSVIMQRPTKFDENGFVTKWSKPFVATNEEVLEEQNKYGTKFTITTEQGDIPVFVMEYGRLQIPIVNFSKVKESLGLDIFKQVATKTSYSDLYEANENGDFVQKASDFGVNESETPYTPEEVLEVAPGTNTFFKVNTQDVYNKELKEKFDNDEITIETVINQVKVYNTGANGKILGDLKSNKEILDETDNYLEIRRIAAEILVDKIVAQDLVTIPYTAKAAYVLLGTPNLTMVKTEDGVVPQSIQLTDVALERIQDYGYIENGVLKLNGDTKNVRMDFVSKLSKKGNIPVIIFKEGNYNVAYPVSLVKKATDKSEEIGLILSNNRLNKSEKTTLINSILAENEIKPNLEYTTEESQNVYNEDGSPSSVLQTSIDLLKNKKDTIDVEDWLDPAHDKNYLKDDVTITINLEERVLKSPKLVIDFKNAERNDADTPWYDTWVTTGEISDEQINIIANKVAAFENLSDQEIDIYNNERERTKEAIDNIINLSAEKQRQANNKKNEEC